MSQGKQCNTPMKIFTRLSLPLLLVGALAVPGAAQEEIQKDLRPFNKVIASPKVHLILEEGDHESIRLVYQGVSADKINISEHGRTLHIYLDDAQITEKMERLNRRHKHSYYRDATITAYVTYRSLRHVEIRGNQELTCKSPLHADKFVLKAYGENEIRFASIETKYLRTSLYGQNDLKVRGGIAEFQKYRLFGENKIDTQPLRSYSTTTNIYGESRVKVSAQDELRINSFGEARVTYDGNAEVSKGLMFGHTEIHHLKY